MHILGVDIGGTGIKAAPVDTGTGTLITERIKIATPHPAEPGPIADVVADLVQKFSWTGRVGVAFPGVIINGVTRTAANLSKDWIGLDARALFSRATGLSVSLINDADAAGVAEMRFGAGAGHAGVVLMLTFGTGIGSALFLDGKLVPNTEFGHLELDGKDAELRASDRAREEDDMSWEKWAGRVQDYLRHVEGLLSPRLFIIGGGVSKKSDRFFPLIDVRTPMVAATLLNNAGIIGAAVTAEQAAGDPGAIQTDAAAAAN